MEVLALETRAVPAFMPLGFGPWSCCSTAPGAVTDPAQLESVTVEWLAASVPGTVASMLADADQWEMNNPPTIDSRDWWYRTTFAGPNRLTAPRREARQAATRTNTEVSFSNGADDEFDVQLSSKRSVEHRSAFADGCGLNEETQADTDEWRRGLKPTLRVPHVPVILCFDGLATLAEVWLNGEKLFESDNMFRMYRLDVSERLRDDNELAIRFRSMTEDLQKKRSRPRWKTNLVNQQQLRWRRTTLIGRIPGWCPPVPTIGPWRDIRLECFETTLTDVHLLARVEGSAGVVTIRARLRSTLAVECVLLQVGSYTAPIEFVRDHDSGLVEGELSIPDVPLWWPHTHGSQPLFDCRVIVDTESESVSIDCGQVGFRTLHVDREDGFSISFNGQPIYCRGACWTISNVYTLNGTKESLRRDLSLARDAGANMLRVIGTMVYESDLFYQLCDELGIFVWQDFMFANMDYPVDDKTFASNIETEAREQLRRLSQHPSVVVYCGNSEIEQQAAMLGMPRDLWSNSWFADTLPRLCAEIHPGTGYVPSTPTGGVLPFHPSAGVSHFYGVGAYLRSPMELRQTNVKFTSECMGFANIPEPETVNTITDGALPVVHHPRWKQRVPRDTGAGWDFEDVRDHYLKQVYGVDPVLLRSSNMNRYIELSRVIPGELMSQTFSEWRSGHSQNRGGLIWFFKDLWPAAGWGVVDSSSTPKATYYFLKRTWQTQQIVWTDEGLNGLHLHTINESSDSLRGFVEVVLLKEPNVIVARNEVEVNISGRGQQRISADEILGGFYDVSYAYRFGPPHHDVAVATLFDADHRIVSEAFHFIRRRESYVVSASVDAMTLAADQQGYQVTLRSDRFLHNVRLSANEYLPDDNYFHLMPGREKVVRFVSAGHVDTPHERGRPCSGAGTKFRVEIEALNLENPITASLS